MKPLLGGRFRLAALVAVAVCAAGVVAAQGAASEPKSIPVSGDYAVLDFGQPVGCHANTPGFICNGSITGAVKEYSGDLEGTSSLDYAGVTDCKTGTVRAHGTETFTGSVAGVGEGTLTFEFHAAAKVDCLLGTLSDFSGRLVVKSSSGDLAGLNGSIQLAEHEYDGELH